MARKKAKRGPGRPPKKKNQQKAQHSVPGGFWRQVAAVLMVIFGVILMLGLFGIGGVFPVTLAGAISWLIGWTAFVVPLLFLWQAIQIFRAEENRLPAAVWVATVIFLALTSGIFQLLLDDWMTLQAVTEPLSGIGGGFIGWLIDAKALGGALEPGVLALILVVFDLILLLFVLAIPPKSLFTGIRNFFGREDGAIDKKNEKIAQAAKDNGKIIEVEDEVIITGDEPGPISKMPKMPPIKKPEPEPTPEPVDYTDWEYPKLSLLADNHGKENPGDVKKNAELIRETFAEFGYKMGNKIDVKTGPRITQYALEPPRGVKMSKFAELETNIASNLQVEGVTVQAPIPNTNLIGVEVPNLKPAYVGLRSILESQPWQDAANVPMSFAIGRDVPGNPIVGRINNRMPHVLIAGAPGTGKSIMLNTILVSLLYKNRPDEMQLILVDPKVVGMSMFKDIPHLKSPIISETDKAISALRWAVIKMEERKREFADAGADDITKYNNKINREIEKAKEDGASEEEINELIGRKRPYIVIVFDELADFMLKAPRDMENAIVTLAAVGRAFGIVLILATQKPIVKVVTGLIKGNITGRLAFSVFSNTDSRVILDVGGAEKLLGAGDMLFKNDELRFPKRIQGAYVSDEEVEKVVHHLRVQGPPDYDPEIISQPVQLSGKGGVMFGDNSGGDEYEQAKHIVVEGGRGSTAYLQRRMKIGYGKAAGYLDQMEEEGIVGPSNGAKGREVLVSSLDTTE